jgi:uncharacterized Zn finger protein
VNDTDHGPVKSISQISSHKALVSQGIEQDIKFLLENPLKLKKFKNYIEMIKTKSRRTKEKQHVRNYIKNNIEKNFMRKYQPQRIR